MRLRFGRLPRTRQLLPRNSGPVSQFPDQLAQPPLDRLDFDLARLRADDFGRGLRSAPYTHLTLKPLRNLRKFHTAILCLLRLVKALSVPYLAESHQNDYA